MPSSDHTAGYFVILSSQRANFNADMPDGADLTAQGEERPSTYGPHHHRAGEGEAPPEVHAS